MLFIFYALINGEWETREVFADGPELVVCDFGAWMNRPEVTKASLYGYADKVSHSPHYILSGKTRRYIHFNNEV